MPKIRNKVLEISGYDGNNDPVYNLKSGVLTKNFKKILNDSDFDQGEIPTSKETTGKILDDFSHYFDDSKTINIVNKTVNHTFGIEESYKSEANKILHTPNTFDENSAFNVTKDTNFSMYDNVLYKDNFEIQNTPYKEDYIDVNNTEFSNIQSTELDVEKYRLSDQVAIEIDLNFDVPIILQNNKSYYSNNYTDYISTITTNWANPFTKIKSSNSPTSYYNFNLNRWEYIENPYDILPIIENNEQVTDQEYNDKISESNLAFSPGFVPVNNEYTEDFKNEGIVCFNSKFPIGSQWYTNSDSLLDLSRYITNDFLLEKVIFECESVDHHLQSSDVIGNQNDNAITINHFSSNLNHLSNTINFFLLNQYEDNFNPISFWEGSGFEVDKKYTNKIYFDKYGINTNALSTSSSVINDYLSEETINKFYIDNNQQKTSFQVTTKNSTREIIATSNILIYNDIQNSNIFDNNYEYFNSKIEITGNISNANFINQKISCESFVSIPLKTNLQSKHHIKNTYQTELTAEIFSSNFLGGRDLQDNDFGRDFFGRSNFNSSLNEIPSRNHSFINYKNKYYNTPYILKATDRLIFGINSYANGNIIPYVTKINDKIKIKLIGRHVVGDKKTKNKTQSKTTSKSVRKQIDNNIYDKWDVVPTESVFNGFYDNIYNNEEIYTTHENILDREIYGKVSSKNFGSFNNTVKLFDNKNSTIYDSVMPNPVEYYKTSGNINVSFNNIRLSYEVDSNYDNENYQWISSYPFESQFENIHSKRDNFIDLAALGIEKFNIKVDKYLLPTECYQYYKIDSKYGNYNSGTVFKKIQGYIETETLTDESSLHYLNQGKSISTAVPTNTFADVYIGSNNIPYIVRLQGDIFDIDKDFVGEGKMPDTLTANSGRLVFYNTNIETNSDQTFNFKNISNPDATRQKFLPFKVIARLGSSQSGSDRNDVQTTSANFTNTYSFSYDLPGGSSNFAYAHSLDNTFTGFSYYPYLENNTILNYQANDFESEDVLDRLNKVFFGYTNIKGKSYRYYPLVRHDGWKYGIYNSKQSGLSYNFNWNSYGQFKDKYYGSKNTAIYKNDNEIEWPIVKKFVNKYFYPVGNNDNSLATYNKDYYARSNYPYIEDSQNTLSQYYNS